MIPADMIAAISYQYPHIAERIVQTWGDPLCLSYMTSLLLPDEYGAKELFSRSEAGALMRLIELHDDLHPPVYDVWALR
jgi:hypothetical protein